MKIRLGHVGNSSSSSFLIYGVCIPTANTDPELGCTVPMEEDYTDNERPYEIEAEVKKMPGLSVGIVTGADSAEEFYIGESWGAVGDDQTGKQFKESVQKQIEEVLRVLNIPLKPEGLKCDTHSEAWHDG